MNKKEALKTLILSLVIILAVITVQAQNEKGIQFETGTSWKQILEKAKSEHKYIFVDCYATWCGPCKLMEQEVYNKKEVADTYNQNFVSVKVQMDKTKNDAEATKNQYGLAEWLAETYTVNAYPTFLFFDENGKPVHKVIGAMDKAKFMGLATDVKDTSKQYYTLLKNFQPNTLDTAEERGLPNLLDAQDHRLAGRIAADYLSRIPKQSLTDPANGQLMVQFKDNPQVSAITLAYLKDTGPENNLGLVRALWKQPEIKAMTVDYVNGLDKARVMMPSNLDLLETFHKNPRIKQFATRYINSLADGDLYTKEIIGLVRAYTDTSAGRNYDLFYRHAKQVDRVMQDKDYAYNVVNGIAYDEELNPAIDQAKKTGAEPDWNQQEKKIEEKFGRDYVEDNIIWAKINWYDFKKDSINMARYYTKRLYKQYKKEGIQGGVFTQNFYWNNIAYSLIFLYDNNRDDLEKALEWMRAVNKIQKGSNGGNLDTEANLLYKLGNKEAAIKLETLAVSLDHANAETLKKMKNDQPTWVISLTPNNTQSY